MSLDEYYLPVIDDSKWHSQTSYLKIPHYVIGAITKKQLEEKINVTRNTEPTSN
jgi:hypothetical protein